MVLPSMGIIVSVVVAIGLAVAIYCGMSAKNKVEDREQRERGYIEQQKQEAMQAVDAALQDIDNLLNDIKEDLK